MEDHIVQQETEEPDMGTFSAHLSSLLIEYGTVSYRGFWEKLGWTDTEPLPI